MISTESKVTTPPVQLKPISRETWNLLVKILQKINEHAPSPHPLTTPYRAIRQYDMSGSETYVFDPDTRSWRKVR
jgi:hypothetical protein